jgi:hypothetical protein
VKYYVSLKANLSASSSAYTSNGATNNLGVRFTNMPPPTNPWAVLPSPLTNNISQVYSTSIITDTINWTTISGSFVADSAYNYIVIGNFFTDSLTDTLTIIPTGSNGFYGSYYFVDDICVSTDSSFCLLGLGINENNYQQTISIFPNPFSTQTVLQTENFSNNATLTVDNVFGQTVKQIKNISGQTVILHRDNLPSGLYFIRLTEDNKLIVTEKIIIAD